MNKQKWMKTLSVLSILGGAVLGNAAHAEIEAGFYKGHFKNDSGHNVRKAEIFVENVMLDGVPVSYGLIISKKAKGYYTFADVFRIEELLDGTQAWIKINRKASGLIGSNANQDATYNVSLVKDGTTHRLTFTATKYGISVSRIKMFEIIAKKSTSQSWEELPMHETNFKKRRAKQNVFVSKSQINGRYYVNDKLKNGSASVREVIPNIGVIRSQSLNSESEDGRSMDREITAFITILHKKWNIFGGDRLIIIDSLSSSLNTLQ